MKILIADDHPIFRKGLKEILESEFDASQIIECCDGDEATREIFAVKPDVAILDINMPGKNGLDLCSDIAKDDIPTRVIILTMYREKEMIRRAMQNGAHGYILKDFAVEELLECIKSVLNHKRYIGPTLQPIYNEIDEHDKKKTELLKTLNSLSQAELKILKLVGQNHTSKKIAELLFLSEKTVENYRSKICSKLDLPPRNNNLLLWVSENKEALNSISEF